MWDGGKFYGGRFVYIIEKSVPGWGWRDLKGKDSDVGSPSV